MIARPLPFLLLVGCIEFHDASARIEMRPRVRAVPRENSNVTAQRHQESQEAAERIAARIQRQEAEKAERDRAAAQKKADDEAAAAEALARSCAEGRDERRAKYEAHLKSYEERDKLLEWEEKHCKVVDHGKPVVREYEMPNGVIVKRRVISGYPVRECDAKEPKGLPPWRIGTSYRTQGLVKLTDAEWSKMDACIDADMAVGWDHVDHDGEEPAK